MASKFGRKGNSKLEAEGIRRLTSQIKCENKVKRDHSEHLKCLVLGEKHAKFRILTNCSQTQTTSSYNFQ